jgi:hypothetical protein
VVVQVEKTPVKSQVKIAMTTIEARLVKPMLFNQAWWGGSDAYTWLRLCIMSHGQTASQAATPR